jgi:uncharacterized protein (TIGR00290 family)
MSKVLLFWSSGKDSAMAYQRLVAEGFSVAALITTTRPEGYVPFHEVPFSAVVDQARAIGLPLWRLPLPHPCPNTLYESLMSELFRQARQQGFTHVAFGDLFLTDIRAYRAQLVEKCGLKPLFPIWVETSEASPAYVRSVLQSGIRAIITAVDTSRLPADLVGEPYDEAFLERLPPDVDPAGEYGEFHTFVQGAPFFRFSVSLPPPLPHAG